jgi:hypothetical protein
MNCDNIPIECDNCWIECEPEKFNWCRFECYDCKKSREKRYDLEILK